MREENIERSVRRRFGSFCAAFLAASLLFTVLPFGLLAQAVELDGLLKEKMWLDVEPFTVIRLQDESNCSVEEAKIFVCFDEKNNITYIGCRLFHQKPTAEAADGKTAAAPQSLSGVAVQVENTDFLSFTTQSADEVNNEAYQIQGAACSLSDVNTTAEIRIGQKRGFGDPLHVQLRFYDADGVASNVYALSIPSPTPSTTAAVVTVSENMTTAPPKTTKPTTSRTQKETQPTTQRTTQEKTTVEKTTVEKTTKEKTTKEKTTKLKTTKAPKTTKAKTTAVRKAKTTKTTQPPVDSNEVLQEVLAEQTKTRTALYIGVGVLIVALFIVCSYAIKKKDG